MLRRTRRFLVALALLPVASGLPAATPAPGDAAWVDLPVEPWARDFGYATGVITGVEGDRLRLRIREIRLPDTAGASAAAGLAEGAVATVPAARVVDLDTGRTGYERRRALIERLDAALALLPAWAGTPEGGERVTRLAGDLRAGGFDAAADQLALAWHLAGTFRRAFSGTDPRAHPGIDQLEAVAGAEAFGGLVAEIERLGLAARVRRAINSVALDAPWVGRRRVERAGAPAYVIHAAPRRDRERPAAIADAGTHAAVLGLGRVCQLTPLAYLENTVVRAAEARPRIERILHRCFAWVTEDGARLPAGVSLARAVRIHADALMAPPGG